MGPVGAGPVAAAFYNFCPPMVAAAVPACWDVVDSAVLVRIRAETAAEALAAVCSPGTLDALVGALPLLRRLVAACWGQGRILTGVNRALWPHLEGAVAEPLAVVAEVWQATTTLREHRGDGHVAALVVHGLSGLEAHLLVTGTEGVAVETLRDNRGWSEQDWQAGADRLVRRGLLDAEGRATEEGHVLRRAVEAMTDQLAEVPWGVLESAELGAVAVALRVAANEIQGSGLYPFPNPMGLPQLVSSRVSYH
jgi:hypothetical protein